MSETPAIGVVFHAIVLRALSEQFPARGEVVVCKMLDDGRLRIRSRHVMKNQPLNTQDFDAVFLKLLRIIPNTDEKPKPRLPTIWELHVQQKAGKTNWLQRRSRESSRLRRTTES